MKLFFRNRIYFLQVTEIVDTKTKFIIKVLMDRVKRLQIKIVYAFQNGA